MKSSVWDVFYTINFVKKMMFFYEKYFFSILKIFAHFFTVKFAVSGSAFSFPLYKYHIFWWENSWKNTPKIVQNKKNFLKKSFFSWKFYFSHTVTLGVSHEICKKKKIFF